MWRALRWIGGILLGLLLVAVVLAGVGFWWLSTQPRTFDECMIAQMRGVDAALIENVRAVCEKRFYVQTEQKPSKGEWMWSAEEDRVTVTLLSPFSTKFDPLKADVEVSSKLCAAATPGDFIEITLYGVYDDLKGFFPPGNAKCMKLDTIWVVRQ